MFVVTGITGKVGQIVAKNLLDSHENVVGIIRDEKKSTFLKSLGCHFCIADLYNDIDKLSESFKDADGVFLLTPPNYDPEPGFPQTKQLIDTIIEAVKISKIKKLVFLSTVGAHVSEYNLLNNSQMMEDALKTLDISIGILRAGWFMENAMWDMASAKQGVIHTYLQPSDHKIPMVSIVDIGFFAAKMLKEDWVGTRIVELEGPNRYSVLDIATSFSKIFEHAVQVSIIPKDTWEAEFYSQGMKNPLPRIRMLDGFNEGWIDFEYSGEHIVGKVSLDEAIKYIVDSSIKIER